MLQLVNVDGKVLALLKQPDNLGACGSHKKPMTLQLVASLRRFLDALSERHRGSIAYLHSFTQRLPPSLNPAQTIPLGTSSSVGPQDGQTIAENRETCPLRV